MAPFPSLGEISFTKFTSPEATVAKLKNVVPGTTTAKDVEDALLDSSIIPGSTPEPLWNDLLAYDPPLAGPTVPAGAQVAVDNELLRAARADRADRHLLLWTALNLADPRLDTVVREILTDADGRLEPSAVNRTSLEQALAARNSSHNDVPTGPKATTNILSLLERCELIEPTKQGGSIVGIDRPLPTRHAVRGAVALIAERLGDRGFKPAPGGELDLALSIGANAWLNLSPEEFRQAYVSGGPGIQAKSVRKAVPNALRELDAQVRRKGQVVLHGPPGAGKTYVARRYVRWATARRSKENRLQAVIDSLPANERNVEGIADEVVNLGLVALWDIVQFHPGYDYTDFVRALVAEPHGTGVTFTPQHRILSLIAAVGINLEERGYDIDLILLLDEINRGDIPNIFGELLYALEYRWHAVATPYAVGGSTSLIIPKTLRVIGTMNTADRSIAVIDYALRRRFVFLDVASTDAPITTYAFDDERTREAALYLYGAAAGALAEAPSGLQVGPSYFLAKADADDSLTVLASRFVYEVLPLLKEYELEGEVDSSAVAELRRSLGLSDDSGQAGNAAELKAFLAAEPWTASVAPVPTPPSGSLQDVESTSVEATPSQSGGEQNAATSVGDEQTSAEELEPQSIGGAGAELDPPLAENGSGDAPKDDG